MGSRPGAHEALASASAPPVWAASVIPALFFPLNQGFDSLTVIAADILELTLIPLGWPGLIWFVALVYDLC